MKRIILSIAVLWSCLLPLKAFTYPMLSDDGSLLTGVLVNGQLYDVTFGDAVLGDIYPASVFSQPGWFDLANAVKQGIVDALNALPTLPAPSDINGCGINSYNGCLILIPDAIFADVPPRFGDSRAAALSLNYAYRDAVSSTISVLSDYDTADYAVLTFAQFRAATVPTPGSLQLVMLALIAVGWFHLRTGQALLG